MMLNRIRKSPLLMILVCALLIIILIGVFTPRNNRLTAGLSLAGHIGSLRGRLNIETMGNQPCVALFYAPWCGHCKKIKPTWNKIMKNHDGKKLKVIDVNCDENKELAKKHNIQGFPTIKFLPNGLDVSEGSVEHNGGRSESELLGFINKHSN